MTGAELARLREAVRNPNRLVEVMVTGCAYSCCGRGWQRRDGYEQIYCGWVDNLVEPAVRTVKPSGGAPGGWVRDEGTFMLYSPGIGAVSYVIACRFSEVAAVGEPGELRRIVGA